MIYYEPQESRQYSPAAEILDFHVELAAIRNPFGRVLSAAVMVQGKMRRLETPILAPVPGFPGCRFEIPLVSALRPTPFGPFARVWVDDKETASDSADGNLICELCCLWLANIHMMEDESDGDLCGLLLKRVEDIGNDETYTRVGFWTIYLGYKGWIEDMEARDIKIV